MAGLGWQELVIVMVIVSIGAVAFVPIFGVLRAMRVRPDGDDAAPEYAGFWLRAGGEIVDLLILGVLAGLAAGAAGLLVRGDAGNLPRNLVAWIVGLFYVVIGNGRGATWGKRWARLRVIDATGNAPGLRRAAVRAVIPYGLRFLFLILSVASARSYVPGDPASIAWIQPVVLAIVAVMAVDYLWMIRDPRKQTLHDKLAGTFVVLA